MAHGGGEHEGGRVEAPAGGEQHLALGEVDAPAAHVRALLDAFADENRVAVALGVLLDDDGVGALRQRRTREDAHGLAAAEGAGEALPGRRLADHGETLRQARQIRRAERIAVHGRRGKRRLR